MKEAKMEHRLYHGSDRFAWHARRWPTFAARAAPEAALVLLPVYSMTDWGLGLPLDAEEVLGSALLDAALSSASPPVDALVLPPFRYTPRLSAATAFTLDLEDAHRQLRELLVSAARPGFRRFVLYNTSPFLEEWIDVAARDLRVEDDLQLFCLNLSGLGLDFHPQRGGDRRVLQAICEGPLGLRVDPASVHAGPPDPIPDAAVKTSGDLRAEAHSAGEWQARLTARLLGLLREIDAHPPLNPHQPSTIEKSEEAR